MQHLHRKFHHCYTLTHSCTYHCSFHKLFLLKSFKLTCHGKRKWPYDHWQHWNLAFETYTYLVRSVFFFLLRGSNWKIRAKWNHLSTNTNSYSETCCPLTHFTYLSGRWNIAKHLVIIDMVRWIFIFTAIIISFHIRVYKSCFWGTSLTDKAW